MRREVTREDRVYAEIMENQRRLKERQKMGIA